MIETSSPAERAPGGGDAALLKKQILAAIADHIRDHGRLDWDRVRERPEYASIIGRASGEAGRRKFWRWVDAVSQPPRPDKTKPHQAGGIAADAFGSAVDNARRLAQHLPAVPSPAYLMRDGAQATRNIDWLAEVNMIYRDASRVRNEAVTLDETAADGERITDTKLFDRSITRRVEVINTVVRLLEEIWDLQRQQRLHEAIKDIFQHELAAFPEVQARIIGRLEALDAQEGMTLNAGARS